MDIIKQFFNSVKENFQESKGVLPFHRLEQAVIEFIKNNQQKGLKNPIYLEIILEKLVESYKVHFKAYYKNLTTDKYQISEKTGSFAAIQQIPASIANHLATTGSAKIKIDNVMELLLEDPSKTLPSLTFSELEKLIKTIEMGLQFSSGLIKNREVLLEDKLFKKAVHLIFTAQLEGKAKQLRRSFTYGQLLEFPKDMMALLEKDGEIRFGVDG